MTNVYRIKCKDTVHDVLLNEMCRLIWKHISELSVYVCTDPSEQGESVVIPEVQRLYRILQRADKVRGLCKNMYPMEMENLTDLYYEICSSATDYYTRNPEKLSLVLSSVPNGEWPWEIERFNVSVCDDAVLTFKD